MKRVKRHKVKREQPETSTSVPHDREEHDLAYYIHDRVELMHQVFSCIKYRDLKAMAPECVRHITIDDLQELCTEELLGISSKRLCAVLDGAEPPSDTESSSSPSPDNLETISLDSISSDEEILSQSSSKKSKKHKHHRHSKSKRARCKPSASPPAEAEWSRASRAGLTVLELLELQARARAIRAQLQQDQLLKQVSDSMAPEFSHHSSDGEVEIKEEPAVVVEISSDEEKPKIEKPVPEDPPPPEPQASKTSESAVMTKRVREMTITVPQAKQARKIKLNRTKVLNTVPTPEKSTSVACNPTITDTPKTGKNDVEKGKKDKVKRKKKGKKKKVDKDGSDHDEITLQLSDTEKMDLLEDLGRKSYDNGPIVDSGSSLDTDSDSSGTDVPVDKKVIAEKPKPVKCNTRDNKTKTILESAEENKKDLDNNVKEVPTDSDLNKNDVVSSSADKETVDNSEKTLENEKHTNTESDLNERNALVKESSDTKVPKNNQDCEVVENTDIDTDNQVASTKLDLEITISDKDRTITSNTRKNVSETKNNSATNDFTNENVIVKLNSSDIAIQGSGEQNTLVESETAKKGAGDTNVNTEVKESEKELSEGELSGKESSEIEAVELKPVVVCISDDEKEMPLKKKKKKDKKCKKVKKSKKKDFRESSDQNFYKEIDKQTEGNVISIDVPSTAEKLDDIIIVENKKPSGTQTNTGTSINEIITKDECLVITIDNDAVIHLQTDTTDNIQESKNKGIAEITSLHRETISEDLTLETIDLDEVYEILELSDDSSCYEVEGTVLSKEPTAEEIEALSAKIDEIERVDVVTEEEIKEYESEMAEVENISWKDRYLDSAKVKKILTTANIFNALRKKNIELKKKIEESKKETETKKELEKEVEAELKEETSVVLEGTIEHYKTLQGSTKYVDPVTEVTEGEEDNSVTRELKKDAKKLLKMYKRLLKYTDMDTKKDPKKKKKKKKRKDGDKEEGKTVA